MTATRRSTALFNEQIAALSDAEVPGGGRSRAQRLPSSRCRLWQELTVPGLVQTIVLGRAGGRTGVPERERSRATCCSGGQPLPVSECPTR
jgi:precorrin-4 methylase